MLQTVEIFLKKGAHTGVITYVVVDYTFSMAVEEVENNDFYPDISDPRTQQHCILDSDEELVSYVLFDELGKPLRINPREVRDVVVGVRIVDMDRSEFEI